MNYTDSIYASSYDAFEINIYSDFLLKDTNIAATTSNINRKTIVPVALYDANDDGVFDVNDVSFVMSVSAEDAVPTEIQRAKSDINGDAYIDGFDAAKFDRIFSKTS
jgi:hypothetical protein